MGDMLVAYEDDVPKDRGLKVSGHCALDSGLGCANTFAPYCIHTIARKNGHPTRPIFDLTVCAGKRVLGRGFFVYVPHWVDAV